MTYSRGAEMSTATSSIGKQRTITRLVAVMGLLAGLAVLLTGCFGGNKNVYQSVGSEVADGGWIIIDGDSVTLIDPRSEEHTSELQSRFDLVCRLLLEKKKTQIF